MSNYFWLVIGITAILMFLAANPARWEALKRLIQRTPTYERQPALFTNAEINFYKTLVKAVDNDFLIMGKVRVADLLKVKAALANPKDKRTAFNKITGKHIDFVLVDKKTMAAICCIELDDSSHNRRDRRDRDDFLNKSFKQASLPLLRVPCARAYREDKIRALVRRASKSSIKDLADLQLQADDLEDTAPVSELNSLAGQSAQRDRVASTASVGTSSDETPTETSKDDETKFRQYLERYK